MALSERERQMLEEMEEAIRAEDPRFASQMNGSDAQRTDRRRVILGVIGAVAGLGLVLLGINTNLWVGVAGFALIVASIALAITPGGSGRSRGQGLGLVGDDGSVRQPRTGHKRTRAKKAGKAAKQGTFMQRMEQRWEERRQQGQGW
ncbi:hypothetical protein ASG73_11020 [Janibacter sp. Soil728]|uniref:DUF3040 domain-containing protein n=1 Tax=Janibacter sp. Soil728 TaxID=1736393 RepID=UPI0006F4219A|nr:DUF3040 domain-containing protein [Janibacter sp. Soil728]KRE36859.1 hypothetical protein ASG73_11020 [Janibacter sp. Soil728]